MPVVPWISFTSGDNRHSVQARLVNWYEEKTPEEDPRLIPTAGLNTVLEDLGGAIRGMYQRDNLVEGDLLVLAGENLHRISPDLTSSIIGTVPAGNDPALFASTAVQSVMLVGGVVYEVTADALNDFPVSFGEDVAGDIVSVVVSNNRYVYVDNSGAGRIWWSDELAPTVIEGFATLEASPDGVLAATEINGSLAFFGPNTIELWGATINPDAPFSRRGGGVLDKGIFSQYSLTKADFGMFIIGDDAVVYRFSNFSPSRISTHGIETILEDLPSDIKSQVRMTAHAWRGHQFIQIDVPKYDDETPRGTETRGGVYVYDIATQKGHERESLNRELYRGANYVRCFGRVFVGDRYEGKVFQMTEDVWTVDGEDQNRIACAFLPIVSGTPVIGNLAVDVVKKNPADEETVMSLRWSYNRGETWGNPITRQSGGQSDAYITPIFGPLGRARGIGGVLFELSTQSRSGESLGPVRVGEKRV